MSSDYPAFTSYGTKPPILCRECNDMGVLERAEGVSRCSCAAGPIADQGYIDMLIRWRNARTPVRTVQPLRPLLNPITQADIDAARAARGKQ